MLFSYLYCPELRYWSSSYTLVSLWECSVAVLQVGNCREVSKPCSEPNASKAQNTNISHRSKISLLGQLHLRKTFIMVVAKQDFQPQVPDTSNGPHVHTYIPRADGSILVGGVAYIPQSVSGGGTAPSLPISAANVTPVVVHPGGEVQSLVPPLQTQPFVHITLHSCRHSSCNSYSIATHYILFDLYIVIPLPHRYSCECAHAKFCFLTGPNRSSRLSTANLPPATPSSLPIYPLPTRHAASSPCPGRLSLRSAWLPSLRHAATSHWYTWSDRL